MKGTIYTLFLFLPILAFAQSWQDVGGGTNNGFGGGIYLKAYQGKLIAGGQFDTAGHVYARGHALWDGDAWSVVDNTFNFFMYGNTMEIFEEQVYTPGVLYPLTPMSLYRLDHNFKWHQVPNTNFWGTVYDMIVYGGQLYVCGQFDTINGTALNNIARWDGTTWHPLGSGLSNYAVYMEVFQEELYVCGQFHQAGNTNVNRLARWDGYSWKTVGSGLEQGNFITTMKTYKDELYLGGSFKKIGGVTTPNIAKWNGVQFSTVDSGMGQLNSSDFVTGMGIFQEKLYVGGYFGTNDGIFMNKGGIWDGLQWDSLPPGLSSGANDFVYYDCHLYAGGSFTGNTKGVAMLDVYDCTLPIEEDGLENTSFYVYPNPTNGLVFIPINQYDKIYVFDATGKQVDVKITTGQTTTTLDFSPIAHGIYFLRIKKTTGAYKTIKLIKQ